ncbi:MAG: 50S ribosomal protein L32 [Candidatus Colwellbacteria bacterium CG10_big_fil_rev_8_21_14_0_10_41_28]|uniref:Large ribosomal subunit protein bL32 n=1 Tax=Candidatus Colwellbacteria bacterium CG10_big_fil_rev_8_21_14_0_10_41_28 TaxID=1974539 RepID=A0A2H0VHG7_9BACT|nr:MAG: 50S ribosomal protein L32 [Candidatus Colwellbacteria bacterium CG10_big_fil_rev_8_21_14_0_10_41_28]
MPAPAPKKRHSKSKVGRRRANQGLKKINVSICTQCKAPKLPHRLCSNCGAK